MKDINIEITTENIKLTQLLKLADICTSGGEVKPMVAAGVVFLNGVPVSETRKKIYPGDYITIESHNIKICISKA